MSASTVDTFSDSTLETIMSNRQYRGCIGVFWDMVDFPFPDGLSPAMIYHNLKLFVQSLPCPAELISVMVYADKSTSSGELVDAFKKVGITIFPRQADEYTRYRAMALDIAWWEADISVYRIFSQKVMLVISKEVKRESLFYSFFQSMASHPIYFTPAHDPPPTKTGYIEPISFILPSEPIPQSVTEESLDQSGETVPDWPIESSMPPDCPVKPMSSEPRSCIFWDLVDYPLPLDDPCDYDLRRVFGVNLDQVGFPGECSVVAYADEEPSYDQRNLLSSLLEDAITIIIIPHLGDRYRRVHKMSTGIVLWAMENPATFFEPKTLMVISKSIEQGTDVRNALEALENRHYNVLLGQLSVDDVSRPPDELIRVEWLSNDVLPKHRREEAAGFSHGVASLFVPHFSTCDTLIIWDVLGCPTDFFSSVFPVLGKKGYHGSVIIRPYADVDDEVSVDDLLEITSECFKCEPIIRVSSKVNIYATGTRMLLDIVFWAMNNDDAPQNLMVISKPFEDYTGIGVFKALERRGFNVIFCPDERIASVDESTIDSLESLCESCPDGKQKLISINNQNPKFQGRILTDKSLDLSEDPVVLFWLVGKCAPSDPMKIWSIFEAALEKKGYRDIEANLRVYIDEGHEMIKEYKEAYMDLIIIPEKDACGKVNSMLLDMITKTRHFESPANFVVISEPFEDPMCDNVVQGMKLRNFNVLFEVPEYLLTFGSSSLWSAKSLLF